MPELPEVETVKRGLEQVLAKQPKIARIEARRKDLRDPLPLKRFREMTGARILEIRRRAKYLVWKTDHGYLLSHLGMTGTWRVVEKSANDDLGPHDHVVIHLEDGRRLIYRDPRRFGVLDWTHDPAKHAKIKDLGPEPLEEWSAVDLAEALRGRKSSVKAALMDASVVVGVGNIYASEALFRAGVRPNRRADRVKSRELDALIFHVRAVLREAIEAGGSTISDFAGEWGQEGAFQGQFKVYDRAGEPCSTCGEKIRRTVIVGRSTFWCAKCQK